jgi:hypothetical protein
MSDHEVLIVEARRVAPNVGDWSEGRVAGLLLDLADALEGVTSDE